MTTPQPIGMSGEEEWWEKEPFQSSSDCEFHHECEDCDGLYGEYDIPAIIAEARRLMIEECIEALDEVKPDLPYGQVSGGSLQTHFHIVAAFEDARIMALKFIRKLL